MAGYDPAIVEFNLDYGAGGLNNNQQVRAGVHTIESPQPLTAATITRSGLVASQYNNIGAAPVFNPLGGASGTGRNWSGGTSAHMVNALAQNNNPHMAGAAEAFPAMTYDPFPSPATLYPKVV